MRGYRLQLALSALLVIASSFASAASAGDAAVTRITVNGHTIDSDVSPFVEQHRVLVPIRAVFTALGAYVEFDPHTKTVIVAQPRSTIELRVFSQRADVNGNTVWLDEPAVVHRGRTLVPLRFIAEASGADVAFDAARNIAEVNLAGGGARDFGPRLPGTSSGAAAIESLTIDTHGKKLLAAGDVIQVNVVGTPGGTATFDLAGIIAGAAMHEISKGTYSGFYIVRAGRNVNDVHAYAHLSVGGDTANATSNETFSVAGRTPSIVASSPAAGERTYVAQPSITASIDDHGGPAVDAGSLRVYLDSTDVTPYSGISARSLFFTPYYPLVPGWHRVGVYGDDVAGIPFSSDWSFFVEPSYAYGGFGGGSCCGYGAGFGQNGFPIYSMSPLQFGTYGPGSVITLVMQGLPGGYALVQLVGTGNTITMNEVAGMPGYYVGTYVVPPGLDLWPVAFNVNYFGPNGLDVHAHEGSGLRFVSTTGKVHIAHTQPVLRRPVFASGVVAAARSGDGAGAVDLDQPVVSRPPQIAPLPVMRLPLIRPAISPAPSPAPRPIASPKPSIAPHPIASPHPVATPRPVSPPKPIASPRPLPRRTPL
ncbi:MAG TPA: stalk domain-containing protein [Candidatus Eremiobacteraceae bacterium]|nr:stalk domain-containing protein [Candidatus Eremiobacteraceae bacterium]